MLLEVIEGPAHEPIQAGGRIRSIALLSFLAAYVLGAVGSAPVRRLPDLVGPEDATQDARLRDVGPQRDLGCPPRAVTISPGADIQVAVDANPRGTAFCLLAGTWDITSPIVPKSGDSFIGRYGATLDASSWQTTDPNQGVFTAHNLNIDNVTIRNLVIRDSPQRGIHAFRDFSDGWVIDHNEIRGCRMGIHHGNFFRISHNAINDNWQYGIGGFRSMGSLIEGNEFAFNASRYRSYPGDSATSKWAMTRDTIVRRNLFHDNHWSAIWFDGQNTRALIENNMVWGNGGNGIFYEVSDRGVIRNNTVVDSGARNIYLSEAFDTEVYENSVAEAPRGIALFQDGQRIEEGTLGDNYVHDNAVRVPAGGLAVTLTCTNMGSASCSTYSISRGNRFDGNRYVVPDPAEAWWYWDQSSRTWDGWRGYGQDPSGTLEER